MLSRGSAAELQPERERGRERARATPVVVSDEDAGAVDVPPAAAH